MSKILQKNIYENLKATAFPSLLSDLMNSTFAKDNGFNKVSLQQINELMIETAEKGNASPEFLKCKETYILILELLETTGHSEFPGLSLTEWKRGLEEKVSFMEENDFYRMYRYFKEELELPFSEDIKMKLLAQQLSLALESIGQKVLHPFLSNWWVSREASINLILAQGSSELKIHPDLSTALERLSVLHQDLLMEAHFPVQTIEHSLSYILSLEKEEDFHPAPIEVGYLLLFFGQGQFLERFLHNALDVHGIESDEIVDFSFRMIRAQKLKNQAFSLNSRFSKIELEMMEEDYAALKEVLSKIESSSVLPVSEAA